MSIIILNYTNANHMAVSDYLAETFPNANVHMNNGVATINTGNQYGVSYGPTMADENINNGDMHIMPNGIFHTRKEGKWEAQPNMNKVLKG